MTGRAKIDDLLERAVRAINQGDRATADALAGQVLAVDRANPEAEELLATPVGSGEIRRLTVLFADLVDSTALSMRVEPEVYRTVVGGYRDQVRAIVGRYEGHIGSIKGDGVLAVFGHPKAHEDDTYRSVLAGLDITRAVADLSARAQRRFGFTLDVRVGVHRGVVFLDIDQDDVYGLGANLAARICSLAPPGTVSVSAAVERLVRDSFEMAERRPQRVKGVRTPLVHYGVLAERDTDGKSYGPLVGRDREIAALHEMWSQASSNTLTTRGVVLRGEGGIGKSRLANAVVDMARESGAVVLGLFGSPFHSDVGLRPVRRLIERQCRIQRSCGAAESLRRLAAEVHRRALDTATVVPLLAPVLGITPDDRYQPATVNAGARFDQITAAVTDYLLACVGSGPALILAEDIHWYDEDTIGIVNALLRVGNNRLMVVVTGRSVPPLRGITEELDLKPLAAADSDILIRSLHPRLKPEARTVVRERCDGVPLFIEEVVAKLRRRPDDFGDRAQVPDTLYEALVARLRSSTESLQIVETAALIGSRFDRDLLSSVTGVGWRRIDALLDELARARVLRPAGKHSWSFHHELLREVAAELSPPSLRRRLHGRIADALAEGAVAGTPEWPLVAHHFEKSERFDEAATAYQRASSDARGRGALNEARNHLSKALDIVELMSPGRARNQREVAIRLERGFLATATTGYTSAEAAAEFERCLQLVSDEPSPEMHATFGALWGYYTARGQLGRVERVIEALRQLEGVSDWTTVSYKAHAGFSAMFRGQFGAARVALEEAVAGIDQTGIPRIEQLWYTPSDRISGLYAELGFVRFVHGDLTGAETAFARISGRCEALPFPANAVSLCYGQMREVTVRVDAGQFDRAAELIADVAARAEQHGLAEWAMVAATNRIALAARRALIDASGDPAALQPHVQNMTAVVHSWRAAELKAYLSAFECILVRLHAAAGDRRAARDCAARALAMAGETGIVTHKAELLRALAHTFDDPDAQCAGLQRAIEVARNQGSLIFEMHCTADLFELSGAPSRPALEDTLSRIPADQSWPELERARALLG